MADSAYRARLLGLDSMDWLLLFAGIMLAALLAVTIGL
jgi:hypothetical protein